MRAAIVLVVVSATVIPGFAQDAPHRFSQNDRYAGCLFGDMVPLLRRGYSRDGALAIASRRCEAMSVGLSKRQVEDAADFVNFSIDVMEH